MILTLQGLLWGLFALLCHDMIFGVVDNTFQGKNIPLASNSVRPVWSQLTGIIFGPSRTTKHFPTDHSFKRAVNLEFTRITDRNTSKISGCICVEHVHERQLAYDRSEVSLTPLGLNDADKHLGSCFLVHGTYAGIRGLQKKLVLNSSSLLVIDVPSKRTRRTTLTYFTLLPAMLKIDHNALEHFVEPAHQADLNNKEIQIEFAIDVTRDGETLVDTPELLQQWHHRRRSLRSIIDTSRTNHKGEYSLRQFAEHDDSVYAMHWQSARQELDALAATGSCNYDGLEIADRADGASIRGLHRISHTSATSERGIYTFHVACYMSLIAQLANLDFVVNVALLSKLAFLNNLAKSIAQDGSIDQVYPYSAAGLNGSSEVIGIGDTGIDETHCMFRNADGSKVQRSSYQAPVTDHSKRKVIQYIDYGDGTDASGGHGSHVSSTAAGSDLYNPSTDLNFGHASGAKIAFFDMSPDGSSLKYPQPMSMGMFTPAKLAGAHIYSGSWGADENIYSSDAVDIDKFLYNNDDFLVVLAAGNEGSKGYYSVVQPGIAKNALTVGASMTGHGTNSAPDSPNSMDSIAFFSSIGPTFDNRIKPDIVAPGYFINSANSGSGCGSKVMAGTSMSTPMIAGVAAQVRQYFRDPGFWASICNPNYTNCESFAPRGATVKAAIIHSGAPMAAYLGMYSTQLPTTKLDENRPDFFQGFGRVYLPNVLVLPNSASSFDLFVHEFSINANSLITFSVDVLSSSSPLKVTITWMDPPISVIAATMLLNDISLKVVSPEGDIYWGNGGSTVDSKNNVEQVLVSTPVIGVYSVDVFANSLASAAPQKVSIVITSKGSVTAVSSPVAITSSSNVVPCPDGQANLWIYLTDHLARGWANETLEITEAGTGRLVFNGSMVHDHYKDAFYEKTAVCLPDGSYDIQIHNDSPTAGSELTAGVDVYDCGVHLSKYVSSAKFTLRGGSCTPCDGYLLEVLLLGSIYGVPYGWHDFTAYKLYSLDTQSTVAVGTLNTGVLDTHQICVPKGRYEIGFSTIATADDWVEIKYDPADSKLYGIEEYLIEVSGCGSVMGDIYAYQCDEEFNCVANTQFVQFTIDPGAGPPLGPGQSSADASCTLTPMLASGQEFSLLALFLKTLMNNITFVVIAVSTAIVVSGISYTLWKVIVLPYRARAAATHGSVQGTALANIAGGDRVDVEIVEFNPQHVDPRTRRGAGGSASGFTHMRLPQDDSIQ